MVGKVLQSKSAAAKSLVEALTDADVTATRTKAGVKVTTGFVNAGLTSAPAKVAPSVKRAVGEILDRKPTVRVIVREQDFSSVKPQTTTTASLKAALKSQKKVIGAVNRKPTLATVKATSSKVQTEKTIPYVLMRKPTKLAVKPTRSIVNFIKVGNTEEASHVRPIRIAVVQGGAYGTNLNVNGGVSDVRKARFFEYGRGNLLTVKTARGARPWDYGNEEAIRALEKLGAINKYELEFHLEETERLKAVHTADLQKKTNDAAFAQQKTVVADLLKKMINGKGINAVRTALKSIDSRLTGLPL